MDVEGMKVQGFKDFSPEEALLASRARGRKHWVCALTSADLVWEWYTALCRTEPSGLRAGYCTYIHTGTELNTALPFSN